MKLQYFLFFLIAIVACNNAGKNKSSTSSDSTLLDSSAVNKGISAQDAAFIELNKKVLASIKTEDYRSLKDYIHPDSGVRVSPYATVSLENDMIIKADELLKIMKENNKLYWGSYDGTGDPIDLSAKEYFTQFVYDVDFINAEKRTINQSSASGNSINNITTIYPECDYVENYFSGFKKEYEGMDWRALRLVFKKEGDRYFLTGIVHDQWTI